MQAQRQDGNTLFTDLDLLMDIEFALAYKYFVSPFPVLILTWVLYQIGNGGSIAVTRLKKPGKDGYNAKWKLH